MKEINEVGAMHRAARQARKAGKHLVLVPTMGSLHEGHLDLVRRARKEGNHITVSVFVNPTQFAPGEDYERYPRDLNGDKALLEGIGGVDLLYAPDPAAMFSGGAGGVTWVSVDRLTDNLCGPFRDGHFRGVTTVVTKLFNACLPDVAVFGLKDAQQFVILDRMARDLDFPVRLVGVETRREHDGLAMSSRNRYLKGDARRQATALSTAVFGARDAIEAGARYAQHVLRGMREALDGLSEVELEYAELVDAKELQHVEELEPGMTVIAAVAAHVGGARLIDNQIIEVPRA